VGVRESVVSLPDRRASIGLVPELAGRTADAFEAGVREHEERWLSPLAVRSYETRGRAREEDACLLRTPFQRDRDRIVHTKAFRRLMHKTQVFVDPAGDHYRTRLTHTLETTGISRGVARALRLNEDLVEAIGSATTSAHAVRPRGRGGARRAPAGALRPPFRHNEHSLRVVDVLERDGRGSTSPRGARRDPQPHGPNEPDTLEGKIVRLVDRVAYINHDIDDAVRAGVLDAGDLPRTRSSCSARPARAGSTRSSTTSSRPPRARATSARARGRRGDALAALVHVRARLPRRGRRGPSTRGRRATVQRIFEHLLARGDSVDDAVDYVAGMTDRFALTYAESLQ
jgi:dGTPase